LFAVAADCACAAMGSANDANAAIDATMMLLLRFFIFYYSYVWFVLLKKGIEKGPGNNFFLEPFCVACCPDRDDVLSRHRYCLPLNAS
jgi:hypothetical protein